MFGAAFGECTSADRAALEGFDRAWGEASVKGDKTALMEIYADDFMGLPGMQNKMTAIDNAVKNAEKNRANTNPDKVTHDHYYISCTPNSATITHRNVVWTPNGMGGKPETFFTRSIHILEKRGSKWQVVSNPPGGDLDDYGTLWYLEQDWNDAGVTRNKDWFEKNYASDFTSISSRTGKLMNRAEDIADTVNDKGTPELNETTDMNIRVDGNSAIVTGIFRSKGKDDKGVAYDRRVRFTDTWIKRDGRWQAWSTAGATITQ